MFVRTGYKLVHGVDDGFDSLQSLNAVDDRGLADVDAERAAGNRGPEMTQQGQAGGARKRQPAESAHQKDANHQSEEKDTGGQTSRSTRARLHNRFVNHSASLHQTIPEISAG